jgi:hypothetical protein
MRRYNPGMSHWPITLDDAIRIVLHDCPDRTASTAEVAHQINARRLYVKRDGAPVQPAQIFLRAKNYPELFDVIDRTTVRSCPAARRTRPRLP